jgi:hypothetical protein
MYRILATSLLVCVISLGFGCKGKPEMVPQESETQYQFRHDGMLDIIGQDNKIKTSFKIEIVEKEEEVMRGLKNRESMEPDQAMLFIFPQIDYYEFWMQDTYLPLDMLFMTADETVFQIVENAKPFSEERITPEKPNSYVLEINAGLAKKLKLLVGDKISWKRNQ